MYSLGAEIKRVVQDELTSREYVLSQGVRDLRKMIQLQPNDFGCIDDKATDYDDLRNCCLCKQTCLFTAIACECDRDKVTCLRHFSLMCKCSNQKKFLLGKIILYNHPFIAINDFLVFQSFISASIFS